jgi:hypothetical protein
MLSPNIHVLCTHVSVPQGIDITHHALLYACAGLVVDQNPPAAQRRTRVRASAAAADLAANHLDLDSEQAFNLSSRPGSRNAIW